ncbi:MAG: LON peptidase substrate-binding domain-containing protein [Thermomicrobiales bacterium]
MEPEPDETLPMFPLRAVLIPGELLPLHIFEQRYRKMLAARIHAVPAFGVVLVRRGREVADQPDVESIGTAATIVQSEQHADGRWSIVVRGGRRFQIVDQDWREGYLIASVTWLDPLPTESVTPGAEGPVSEVKLAFDAYLMELERVAGRRIPRVDLGERPERVGNLIASAMPFSLSDRQHLLAAPTAATRLELLLKLLRRERALLATAGLGGALIEHPGRRFTSN